MILVIISVLLPTAIGQIDLLGERHGNAPIYGGALQMSSNFGRGTVSQVLNHQPLFFWSKKTVWNMRYIYNDQFFDGTGPMFVMIGGQYNILEISNYMSEGLMYEIAKTYKAYMCIPEHRFYGESIPDGDLRDGNLFYLGIGQVLSDLETFITTMKKQKKLQAAQVVVFGVGYAGNLAAWMRLKNSDIVDAAVVSSAPVQLTIDFNQFFKGVQDVLSQYTGCSDAVTNSFASIDSLLQSSDGRARIQKDFNFCSIPKLTNTQQVYLFFKQLAAIIGNHVKYGTNDTIAMMCQQLCIPCIVDDYTRLVNYINNTFGTDCFPAYGDVISNLKDTSTDNRKMARQWMYQACTQVGNFETSTISVFSRNIPVNFYYKVCGDAFPLGASMIRLPLDNSLLNNQYKGKNLKLTNAVFIQGSFDPYRFLGVTQSISSLSPAIVITGASHGADFLPESNSDPASLKDARTRIKNYIKEWLGL